MNILLIGISGSGKSSVGKELAKKLNYDFVEMESLILKASDISSFFDPIFEQKPSLWQEKELEISKELSQKDNQVIACGGRIVQNRLNFNYFYENSEDNYLIVHLEASPETLGKRIIYGKKGILQESDLPKVTKNIEEMISKREVFYEKYADLTVDTDTKNVQDIIKIIINKLDQDQ